MKKGYVANPVIARMPRYYRCIDELYQEKVTRISSAELARRLCLTASQIRQDFSCFGEFGQQGYGYNVASLREEIRSILGINVRNTAILVGCGNLGHTLLNNFNFRACGFWIIGGFEANIDMVGTAIHGVRIYDFNRDLADFMEAHHPDIAILTVPQKHAQAVADQLVSLGIRGIWNFTNHEIALSDPSVQMESVVFQDSLLSLSYRINGENT